MWQTQLKFCCKFLIYSAGGRGEANALYLERNIVTPLRNIREVRKGWVKGETMALMASDVLLVECFSSSGLKGCEEH